MLGGDGGCLLHGGTAGGVENGPERHEYRPGAEPAGGGGGVSPEIFRLYLSLMPEDKQRVDAKIHELLMAREKGLIGNG